MEIDDWRRKEKEGLGSVDGQLVITPTGGVAVGYKQAASNPQQTRTIAHFLAKHAFTTDMTSADDRAV